MQELYIIRLPLEFQQDFFGCENDTHDEAELEC